MRRILAFLLPVLALAGILIGAHLLLHACGIDGMVAPRFLVSREPAAEDEVSRLLAAGELAPPKSLAWTLDLPEPAPDRLVLAHFYPWFDYDTWTSPQLLDRPLRPYSTDEPDDIARLLGQARGAGLDGLVVSWQGVQYQGGWNHRRMDLLLDGAAPAGLVIAALLETTVANRAHEQTGVPVDPEVVFEWLADIVDFYSSDPAYLRVDGRPVVFVYSAQRLRVKHWQEVMRRLRDSGRDPLLIGDATKSAWLRVFDGQFDYASNRLAVSEILPFNVRHSLRVRSYHLLREKGARRRIWAATVSPGYDDHRLTDGRVPRVTDRTGGAYYDLQWIAAINSRADWVLVTSWNEWWENTHIAPSRRYGDHYVRRTRAWAAAFRERR